MKTDEANLDAVKTREEKIDALKRLIPDESLRSLIFNFDDRYEYFLQDEGKCIRYFSNALTLTALVVFNAFLVWNKKFIELSEADQSRAVRRFSNSMIRLYNMMERAYDPLKLDNDFFDGLAVDLQVDYLLNECTCDSFVNTIGIRNFFNFTNRHDILTKHLHSLKQTRLSTRFDAKFGFEQLCECLRLFPYLSNGSLKLTETIGGETAVYSGALSFEPDFFVPVVLDLHYSLAVSCDMFYYMEDFVVNDARLRDARGEKRQSIILNYIAVSANDSLRVTVTDDTPGTEGEPMIGYPTAIEDFLIDYDIFNVSANNSEPYFFKDYIFLNNRYIKYLSLTIADTISSETKDRILQQYRNEYGELFNKMCVTSFYSGENNIGYRWDEIVMLLLLEKGIFEFLRFLLSLHRETYDRFKESFYLRFGSDVKRICDENDSIEHPDAGLNNEQNRIDAQARALILLATKLLTLNECNLSQSRYPESLNDIAEKLGRIYRSGGDIYYKINLFVDELIRVVLFIDVFYHGIHELAAAKNYAELSLEGKKYDNYQAYCAEKEKCYGTMAKKIAELKYGNRSFSLVSAFSSKDSAYYETAAESIKAAFAKILKTNALYSKRNTIENEILFDALGRRKLFTTEEMETQRDRILESFGRLKDCAERNRRRVFATFYNTLCEFLTYLGNDSTETTFLERSVYPVIAKYSNGVMSWDGYRYSYFIADGREYSGGDTETASSIQLKMITDDEFNFDESYYCVPNMNRIATLDSNKHIWISPIIVPCSVFSSDPSIRFMRLEDAADFDQAIELIYESDPHIYCDLFGSLDTAKKVMKLLLENNRSKFFKGHYTVMKDGQEVIAIASMYTSAPQSLWNSDALEGAFRECGIEPSEKTRKTYPYFKNCFDDFIGNNNVLIDDVCVKKEYRRKGIGKALMSYLIQRPTAGNSVLLTVYKDNLPALNLYNSLGFVAYIEDKDARGAEETEYPYCKMIRISI